MPRKDITLELPGRAPIHFADLRNVSPSRIGTYRQLQHEQGGIWRCGEGHPGHLASSPIPEHAPFFRHDGISCATCDEEPAGESREHKDAKALIAADLAHIGWDVDEEYTFDGERHRADVAAWDKRGQLHVIEVQRSYEPAHKMAVRDKVRRKAVGDKPDRVLWVSDTERSRWKGMPLIVCDRDFERTRTGLWSLRALNPDEDPPVVIERGELLERWADRQVTRITWPDRPTPNGPESQWVDRTNAAGVKPKRRKRKATQFLPQRATVCIPCDQCGARVTVAVGGTHETVLCVSCAEKPAEPGWADVFTPARVQPTVSNPSPPETGRCVAFVCPRCGVMASEEFYGPCWTCRETLSHGRDTHWFRKWTVANDAWLKDREAINR